MNFPRILASPLAGTAGVVAVLCLIAGPLHRLTSSAPVALAKPASAAVSNMEISTVLRMRLLAPAKRVVVETTKGKILLDLSGVPAGESEHDLPLSPADGVVELTLQADFCDVAAETAVFLTVMPDAYEERTAYAIGRGRLEETLRFVWHEH